MDVMASVKQPGNEYRADEASAACYHDLHGASIPLRYDAPVLALLTLACTRSIPAEVAEGCAAYADMPDVYGYCVASLAGGLSAVVACEAAGTWEARCRARWVEARLQPTSGVSTEALLGACGDADCRLDVLDFRAEPVLLTQVEQCGTWAAENAPHCVSHAVQRWRAEHPGAEELAEIAAWEGILADWLGHHLAEAVVCDRVGSCVGAPVLQGACERASAVLRAGESECHDPENAPRAIKQP
ncbi:MAG: hypothetical protein ACI8RZ_004085 [Myxococcota bacterium]|jgi:hypothetical protein